MNHREGRFGTQEATAATTIAMLISGIFAVDNAQTYAKGNILYLASFTALLITTAVFLLLVRAMKRQASKSLCELSKQSLTPIFGTGANLVLIVVLIVAAIFPLSSFMQIMTRFIFVEADYIDISIYFLLTIVLIATLGMEIIARTSRILFWVFLLTIVIAVGSAAPSYKTYHLFPMFGEDVTNFILQVAVSTFRYLPPLIALLVVNEGAHGIKYTKKAGLLSILVGGGLSVVVQIALGLTYFYKDLAAMSSPTYQLTMEVRYKAPSLRADKAVLFIWAMGAILTIAYYVYCASLVYARTLKVGDVRPTAACMGCITVTGMAILHFDSSFVEALVQQLYNYSWLLVLTPLLLICLFGNIRKKVLNS